MSGADVSTTGDCQISTGENIFRPKVCVFTTVVGINMEISGSYHICAANLRSAPVELRWRILLLKTSQTRTNHEFKKYHFADLLQMVNFQ